MNVLSLFDGMSCGQVALERARVEVDNYYASEVDKHAISVTKANYPNTQHMGDVTKWREWDIEWASIDLLMGGPPCQDVSLAGKGKGIEKGVTRSGLLYEYVELRDHILNLNPSLKFLVENVKMKKEFMDKYSEIIGVEPVFINSSLVSAQSRQRYYWANWDFSPPQDTGVVLADILEDLSEGNSDLPDCPIGVRVREKSKCVRSGGRNSPFGDKHEWDSPFQRISKKGCVKPSTTKAACLTGGGNSGGNHSDMDIIHTPVATRRYTVLECERLQTVPDDYTLVLNEEGKQIVSNTQRYKLLGNGWTVDVIAHILRGLPNKTLDI